MSKLLIMAALALAACGPSTPPPPPTSYVVLTDADGYTVHVFFGDQDKHWHYYVTPGPVTVMSEHSEKRGKATVEIPDTIQTMK